MKVEISKCGLVSILLASAMVIALVFVVKPVSAGGVASDPGGTTIPIAPGDVFLLRHELYFDDPAKGGYFTIAITWNCPSSDENFTVENVWVHWTTGPKSGENVENVLSYDQPTALGGENAWQVVVKIPAENKVWVDENFNVDIWLRAASEGVPHKLGLFENVLDYGLGIMVVEMGLGVTPVSPVSIHVQVVRDVEVIIEPDSQPGVIGENVVFTVTVKNTGNVWDNYNLTHSDDAGWVLKLDNDYLEIPGNENRGTKLTVSIPDNENLVCTTDNITVIATAVDNAGVTDNDNAIVHAVSSWTGTAVFSLANLYTVNVEKILDLYQGSKLVVKFYDYGDAFENENVIETFTTPPTWHVEENESARHPEGVGVKKARLDLTTDDTENVISTIASYTVRRVDLETRFSKIPSAWFLAPS